MMEIYIKYKIKMLKRHQIKKSKKDEDSTFTIKEPEESVIFAKEQQKYKDALRLKKKTRETEIAEYWQILDELEYWYHEHSTNYCYAFGNEKRLLRKIEMFEQKYNLDGYARLNELLKHEENPSDDEYY